MTSQIVLNEAMIDWITLTTYDVSAVKAWWRIVAEGESKDKKIMQYEGRIRSSAEGSIFVGEGMQKGGMHYLVRVGGALADEKRGILYSQLKQGTVKVSRMDVQITIREPRDWSQWKLFNRSKRRGKTVGWAESNDRDAGKMETVYVGSRSSDRFSRIYIKPSSNGVRLLRLETEYKRDRAHKSAKAMMSSDGVRPGDLLIHEIEHSIADDAVHAVFGSHLTGRKPHSVTVKVRTDEDKTLRWLMEDVHPVFERIAYSHDAGEHLITLYGDTIQEWVDRGGWE